MKKIRYETAIANNILWLPLQPQKNMTMQEKSDNAQKPARLPFLMGLRDGIPIGLGYFAVAFSLGIIAKKAGLTAFAGFICSLFTRASAGEYGAYSLISAEATFAELALMCVITNLRYLLMGASLTQKFAPDTPQWKRILVACCITDEVFGISIAYKGYLAPSYTYGAMLIAGVLWAAGTASGIIAGGALPANIVSALSVALYGMFIAIIIPPAKKDKAVLGAVLTGFILSWLCSALPFTSGINSGTRTIILTIVISAAAALLRPVSIKPGTFGPKGMQ